MKKKQSLIQSFLSSHKSYPILTAIAAGLYPILFYFTNNSTIVNTWNHVGFFAFTFLCIPIVVFFGLHSIFSITGLKKFQKFVLPFLNVLAFLIFMMYCYYAGFHEKVALLSFFLALGFSIFLNSYLKKVIVIQLILALIGVFTLIPKLIDLVNYSEEWKKQPDNIVDVKFKKTPNIYFIQPDGYVNFSELRGDLYQVDYSDFASYLIKEDFTYYEGFRSNYASTLSSNTTTFMMKHHYYNESKSFGELVRARNIIMTDNIVLDILKKNNYKTYFISELPYLLLNKPKISYDVSNFNLDDVSYIGTGLGEPIDFMLPLEEYISEKSEQPKFFFVELFKPGHIRGREIYSEGVEKEGILWKENLEKANKKLYRAIDLIKENDPNALIILMADHGGYVGMDYTRQSYAMTQDRDLIYSIFSSMLAIHWPNNDNPEFEKNFKSSVNVFRILFAYLSENEKYLQYLQPDESYILLEDVEPKGLYKYIDSTGKITLKKH